MKASLSCRLRAGGPRTTRCGGSSRCWTGRWPTSGRSSRRCAPRWSRVSIPPERLLKAKILQAFYSIRSETLRVEALGHDLLSRRFLDLGLLDAIWDRSTFSENRDRLLARQTAELSFAGAGGLARERGWVSDALFTVGY